MRLLAFGIVKEIVGGPELQLELAGDQNVFVLRQTLNARYPRLLQLASYLIAVNDEYAEGDLSISERDEVAIIPPVSGG